MFAIKVTQNKRIPSMYYLLRDNEDFVVHIWTRKSEAEKHLAKLQEVVSQSVILEITDDINASALRRATEKKQQSHGKETLERQQ